MGQQLDVLCVKHSGKPAGLTIYEDSLRTNIIGEFSLKEFLKDNQVKGPVVQTQYAEVQEINRVSYRSLHSTTKIGKKWIPVTAKVIPGVALPLLVGMNFRDGHAECPTMQRQVNDLNTPRIFYDNFINFIASFRKIFSMHNGKFLYIYAYTIFFRYILKVQRCPNYLNLSIFMVLFKCVRSGIVESQVLVYIYM